MKTTAIAASMAAALAACSGSSVPTLPYELTMNSRWIGMKQYEVARILGPAEELPSQACHPSAKLELCMAWGVNHPQKTRFLIGIDGGVVTTYDWDNGRVTKPAEPPGGASPAITKAEPRRVQRCLTDEEWPAFNAAYNRCAATKKSEVMISVQCAHEALEGVADVDDRYVNVCMACGQPLFGPSPEVLACARQKFSSLFPK